MKIARSLLMAAASVRGVDLEFLHSSGDLGGGGGDTASGVSFGDPSSDRLIVVAVHFAISGSSSVASVTIGGVTATEAAQTTGTNTGVSLWYASVPTGASGDIVINYSNGGVARAYVGVWSLKNYDSATPFDNAAPAGGGESTRTATLDTDGGGVLIGAATSGGNSDGSNFSGLDRNDYIIGERGGGSSSDTDDVTDHDVSISCRCICAASWR